MSDETFPGPAADGPTGSDGAAAPETAAPAPEGFRIHRGEIAWAAGIVIVDQIAKAVLRAHIGIHDSVEVIPGLFNLTHVRNSGAAFGFLNAVDFPFKSSVLALVATCALIGIGLYAARLSPHERTARFGLSLVVGGALGNLIDRLALGSVVDFVDVYWRDFHVWAFNVADASITIGVVVMMFDLMGLGRHVSKTT
jgi:signal peptidase II